MSTEHKPHGAGRSSFELIDEKVLFNALQIKTGMSIADIGCGRGDYTIPVAGIVGPKGRVFGIDAWEDGLAYLAQRAKDHGITNIETLQGDVNKKIPLKDHCIDIVIMTTVFHDLLRNTTGETVLNEIKRIAKPDGKLAIVEFHKIPDSPGPPLEIRLTPKELEEKLSYADFEKEILTDVSPYLYLFIAIIKS
jgi:ubiquinone/menaquinone biosynthesis C-methylase UbiE